MFLLQSEVFFGGNNRSITKACLESLHVTRTFFFLYRINTVDLFLGSCTAASRELGVVLDGNNRRDVLNVMSDYCVWEYL